MEIGYKIWLEKSGQTVFGMGIYQLLRLVDETGSLHKAAERLNMSYRAAWGKIRIYEKRLGVQLLEKGRHGRTGAHLTAGAAILNTRFAELVGRLDALVADNAVAATILGMEQELRDGCHEETDRP
jgi:molybdate transport system regulatory protein